MSLTIYPLLFSPSASAPPLEKGASLATADKELRQAIQEEQEKIVLIAGPEEYTMRDGKTFRTIAGQSEIIFPSKRIRAIFDKVALLMVAYREGALHRSRNKIVNEIKRTAIVLGQQSHPGSGVIVEESKSPPTIAHVIIPLSNGVATHEAASASTLSQYTMYCGDKIIQAEDIAAQNVEPPPPRLSLEAFAKARDAGEYLLKEEKDGPVFVYAATKEGRDFKKMGTLLYAHYTRLYNLQGEQIALVYFPPSGYTSIHAFHQRLYATPREFIFAGNDSRIPRETVLQEIPESADTLNLFFKESDASERTLEFKSKDKFEEALETEPLSQKSAARLRQLFGQSHYGSILDESTGELVAHRTSCLYDREGNGVGYFEWVPLNRLDKIVGTAVMERILHPLELEVAKQHEGRDVGVFFNNLQEPIAFETGQLSAVEGEDGRILFEIDKTPRMVEGEEGGMHVVHDGPWGPWNHHLH